MRPKHKIDATNTIIRARYDLRFNSPHIRTTSLGPKILDSFQKNLPAQNLKHGSITPQCTHPVHLYQSRQKRVYYLDVNSLYPFAYLYKKVYLLGQTTIRRPNFERTPFYPTYQVATPELITLEELNQIKSLGYTVTQEKPVPAQRIFGSFLDTNIHIYNSIPSQKKISKLILNSNYGNMMTKSLPSHRLTSAMLSYTRVILYNLRAQKNNPSAYSDTDSILIRHPKKNALSPNIGYLKTLAPNTKYLDEFIAYSPRRYVYHTFGHRVHVGLPSQKERRTRPINHIHIVKLIIIYMIIYHLCLLTVSTVKSQLIYYTPP